MEETKRNGFIAGFSAYILWGLLPIYWKLLGVVPPMELLAWRVAGCGVMAWLFLIFRKKPISVAALNPKVVFRLLIAALLIAGNWGFFIWAIATGRILEASLGYYINPLVNVILGVLFFSEKLSRIRLVAIGLALIGVILMTFDAGTFPWISIGLALQFGFYGMAVKGLPSEIDSIEVLAWETAFLAPIAIGWLVWLGFSGNLHFAGYGSRVSLMLSAAGVVTLVPLWAFGIGAKRIPLSAMGFLQYVAPTMMMLIGTLIYGEAFGMYRAAAFAFVLAALVVYSITLRRE